MTNYNMQKFTPIVVLALLTSCSSTKIKYPAEQTNSVDVKTTNSKLIVAKSAYGFKDKDIVVPSNFDAQGLDNCTFEKDEAEDCPLRKPIVRIYFDGNVSTAKSDSEKALLEQINNHKLGLMFENQLAGLNRFRIVTQDGVVSKEISQQMGEQSMKVIAQSLKNKSVLKPDHLIKIDTVKTADRFYAEYNGMAQYSVEFTSSVIDPYTKEKLAYPNLGKVRVNGTDVKNKKDLLYTEVAGKFYTGFDFTNPGNVNAVFSKMASKGFDILVSRMLTEMPVTAQVLGVRRDQITLDRGRNAGVLADETVILFSYDSGFVDPIAVAVAKPSSESAVAHIVKWKDSDLADDIRKRAKKGIYKPSDSQKIFAVSVGLPQSFVDNRM